MKTALHSYLKNLRTEHNLKMREVVAFTGIDQALISKFENGSRIPTDEQLTALAKCYHLPYQELKKNQIAQKIYEIVANEPYGYEAYLAAEPRLEYLAKKSIEEQIKIDPDIDKALDYLDQLKTDLKSFKTQKNTHSEKISEHLSIHYTYESNKIEGNTLTLSETMLVVKEGITISGKSVNEHLEAINHSEAIGLLYDFVDQRTGFSEHVLLQFHNLILRGINRLEAGKYRNVNVRIAGSGHIPPEPYLLRELMEEYFNFYKIKSKSTHPVLLAAEMHERLVTIHPFVDGNGRTSRLVMNMILLMNGYPLAILKGDQESKLRYFKALESVQVHGEPRPFYQLVIDAVTRTLEEELHLFRPYMID